MTTVASASHTERRTPSRARGALAGIGVHRSRSLDAKDTTSHHGIPITTVARTLLDLAATVSAHRLERALAQAERPRLYDHRALHDVLARANGHRGKAALASAVTQEPQLTRSELEALFLTLARAAGLPPPLVNSTLDVPDRGRLDPDFHWPTHQLIVETDGYDTHRTRAAFQADRRRDAAPTAAGYTVLRFTNRHVTRHPETVIRRLRALMP